MGLQLGRKPCQPEMLPLCEEQPCRRSSVQPPKLQRRGHSWDELPVVPPMVCFLEGVVTLVHEAEERGRLRQRRSKSIRVEATAGTVAVLFW